MTLDVREYSRWYRDLPSGWETIKGKWVFLNSTQKSLANDEQLSATQKYGVIPQRLFMENEEQKVMLALSGTENFKHVDKDDFVISLRSFEGGIERCHYEGCVSPAYSVLKPRISIDSDFFSYLMKSSGFIRELQSVITGIRDGKSISYDQFGSIELPFPPVEEQGALSRFMIHETGRIDTLITKKTRFIELLKEKRQAVITKAVTKGLDDSVEMKDSGVEWIGEIPSHWVTGKLRWFAKIQTGIALGKEYKDQSTVKLPYLRVANVQAGYVDLSEVKELELLISDVERYALKAGDVLMNEGGDNDKLGRGTVWKDEIAPCVHQNHVFAIRTDERLLPEWLSLFTQSTPARAYFFTNSKQSTNLASISSRNLTSLGIPLPSVGEQKEIIASLNNEMARIDTLIAKTERSIELLKEKCSALITAAVTGKIDVREAA